MLGVGRDGFLWLKNGLGISLNPTLNIGWALTKMCATVAAGGDRGERGGGQVEHDPALLPRHLHAQLQEDHRRRLPREAPQVRRAKRSI